MILPLFHSKDTHITVIVNQAIWIGGFLPWFCFPRASHIMSLLPHWAWFKDKADYIVFFTIYADATHECFKMGLIAVHVTARNPIWTSIVKGTKKHHNNSKRKTSEGKTEVPNKNQVQFKQSKTQRSKSEEGDKMLAPVISGVAIYLFIYFSILQLVCKKHGSALWWEGNKLLRH